MTLIERFKLDHPDNNGFSEKDVEEYMIGCPCSYGYEGINTSTRFCLDNEYDRNRYEHACAACWNREIHETPKAEPELKYEINLKEEKKVKDLSAAIRNAVLDSISDSDIEEAVESFFENYDYSDLIANSVREYLESNADDIAEDIVDEAVRSYMADNL